MSIPRKTPESVASEVANFLQTFLKEVRDAEKPAPGTQLSFDGIPDEAPTESIIVTKYEVERNTYSREWVSHRLMLESTDKNTTLTFSFSEKLGDGK